MRSFDSIICHELQSQLDLFINYQEVCPLTILNQRAFQLTKISPQTELELRRNNSLKKKLFVLVNLVRIKQIDKTSYVILFFFSFSLNTQTFNESVSLKVSLFRLKHDFFFTDSLMIWVNIGWREYASKTFSQWIMINQTLIRYLESEQLLACVDFSSFQIFYIISRHQRNYNHFTLGTP